MTGFLGQWITEPQFKLAPAADYLVFAATVLGMVMLLAALYRMLSPRLPRDLGPYYLRTLRLFMAGVEEQLRMDAIAAAGGQRALRHAARALAPLSAENKVRCVPRGRLT